MAKEGSDDSGYAKVEKEKALACLTCSLCKHIISDPTSITECLHTFCKQCIHDEIIEEKCPCCPICNTEVGVNPKLRPDHNLKAFRDAFFDQQGNPKHKAVLIYEREENTKDPVADTEGSSTLPPLPEIIEESFSSMELGASRVPAAAMIRTRKRSKSGRKRWVMASGGPTCHRNEASSKDKDSPVKSSSPKHPANPAKSNPQSASSKQAKALEQSSEGSKEVIDLNKSPPESPSPPSSPVKLPVSAVTTTSERRRITRRQLDIAPMDNASIVILGDSDNAVKRIPEPKWFTLIPESRPGVTALPDINTYIKVEFEESTVLDVKKLIAKKLNFPSEDMVDGYFDGQVLDPASNMCVVGASTKNRVSVLTYARSVPPPPPPKLTTIVLALPCPTARPRPRSRPRRSA